MNKCLRKLLLIGMFIFLMNDKAVAYSGLTKQVTVIDNGIKAVYETKETKLQDFFKEQALVLDMQDRFVVDDFMVDLDEPINKGMVVEIQRKKTMILQINNVCVTATTYVSTVEELLKEHNIVITEKDWMNVNLTDPIYPYMHVYIQQHQEQQEAEFIAIPFATEVRKNDQLLVGQKRIVQEGKVGQQQITWRVAYLGDQEQNRVKVAEVVTQQPVAHIIEEGTKVQTLIQKALSPDKLVVENNTLILEDGQRLTFTKAINMKATSYTASYECTGKHPSHPYFGMTASGTRAKVGTVAVDPRVIPLGTKLYVEGYGFATAEDTGGAVKGNVIDLYFETNADVKAFGTRQRKVYVLAQ